MERIHGGAVLGLEGKVMAAGELTRSLRPVGCGDEQFVVPEV
jgi:hypothetical protein